MAGNWFRDRNLRKTRRTGLEVGRTNFVRVKKRSDAVGINSNQSVTFHSFNNKISGYI